MNQKKITRVEVLSHAPKAILCQPDTLPSLASKTFKGDFLETRLDYEKGPTLYIGLGGKEKLTPLSYKEIGATITKAFKAEDIYSFGVDSGDLETDLSYFTNLTQGLYLGDYSFSLKSKQEEKKAFSIEILSKGAQEADEEHAVYEGIILAQGVEFARNMTNRPANHLRPSDFVQAVKDFLPPQGIQYEVISGEELKEKGLAGLYLIGNSSPFPPQLLVIRYNAGTKDSKKIALVGKGITFDTGGSNLKTGKYMETMQGDMGGAASVVGTLYAMAKFQVRANVVAVLPLAENRLAPHSLVSGDVYTAYDGQTVEVANTDAEGRLVLADAVSYAIKDEKAELVVDIATLTGSVVMALGFGVTGVVDNNTPLWNQLESASKSSGERFMRLPTYPEYHKLIESKVADVKNSGVREGGLITGGLFIGRFAQDKPWLHLDIAGTSWMTTPLFAHQTEGATGTGVDTLYYFCKNQ